MCSSNFPITFDLQSSGNLPRTTASRFSSRSISSSPTCASASASFSAPPAYTVLADNNLNLTSAQKLVLDLHWRLVHINLLWIHWLLCSGIFNTLIPGSTTAICKCQACQLGKQVRRTKGSIRQSLKPECIGSLKCHSLTPGAVVSTDQFVSSTKGRLLHTFGREHDNDKLQGGTLFVEKASDFMYVHNQVSLGASETLIGKGNFEREAMRHGIVIKSYQGDNGVYRSKAFQDDLRSRTNLWYTLELVHTTTMVLQRGLFVLFPQMLGP